MECAVVGSLWTRAKRGGVEWGRAGKGCAWGLNSLSVQLSHCTEAAGSAEAATVVAEAASCAWLSAAMRSRFSSAKRS